MRQYAGFSTAKLTNERFVMLLNNGQTGLSVAFDLPTQLGLDSDDPLSEGEVGKVGVTIDSIRDMRALFEGIDLSKVSTSMTINAPATTLLALYVAVADEMGIERDSLRGTVQNDILKEYIARGLYIFPPNQSLRLTTDLMDWCTQNTPGWNTISVSGYHMREAGCTAIEEIAITLSNALEYARNAVSNGMNIDDFAPRMSFFFACHNNFLEEVSKFRAARKLWHDLVEDEFAPKNIKSKQLRFHTQTAGATLTAQQPMNNIVRVSYQALSAVLGGTQSLHTNSFDEAIGLPTDEAVTIALRTQQLIANETGVIEHPDPLGGSYIVEEMTSEIYDSAKSLIDEIDRMGGSLECIKSGYQQTVIHESAWKYLKGVEDGTISVMGVNTNESDKDGEFEGQLLNPDEVTSQIESLRKLRSDRDSDEVQKALDGLRNACNGSENVMEPLIHALKSEATVGEVNGIMREVFGTWTSPSGV